jgi:hypothetical protein
MLLSMKKIIVLVALALALAGGLIGWTVRMEMLPNIQQHPTSIHSAQLADDPNWYCPAPPRMC